jgi:hypothetical protein
MSEDDIQFDTSTIIFITLTIILAVILLFMGTCKNYHRHVYSNQATATINAVNCTGSASPYHCTLTINYTPQIGSPQTNLVVKGPSTELLNVGSTVTVYYNPSDLSCVSLTKYMPSHANGGFGMMLVGLLVLVVPFLVWYFIYKNDGLSDSQSEALSEVQSDGLSDAQSDILSDAQSDTKSQTSESPSHFDLE